MTGTTTSSTSKAGPSGRQPSAPAYRISEADVHKDEPTLLAIWERVLGRRLKDALEHWRNNPSGLPRHWLLLAQPGDKPVGVAGLGHQRFSVGGEPVLGGGAALLAVDCEHRSLGPALTLQKAVLSNVGKGVQFVYGLPSRSAMPVCKRLGYVPVAQWVRYARPLRLAPYLAQRRILGPATALAARFAGALETALYGAAILVPHRSNLQEVARFDERFDALWSRGARHCGVAAQRTADYLKWRFAGAYHEEGLKTLGLFDRQDGRLRGYAVYHTEGGHAHLLDLFAEDTEASLDDLLKGLVRWTRRTGAVSISFSLICPPELEAALKRAGFRLRGSAMEELEMVVYPGTGAHTQGWYFTQGDYGYI